jgi:hypothetical protein
MSNRYDLEVTALREYCDRLLAEMEKMCYEIDKLIGNSDYRLYGMVCNCAGSDSNNGRNE